MQWTDVEDYFRELCGVQRSTKLLRQPGDWAQFWQILKSPPVCQLIERRISAHRANASTYLEEMGLRDGIPSALVDIGWHARSGEDRRKSTSRSRLVSGYYLATHWNQKSEFETGPVKALFYAQCPDRQRIGRGFEIHRRATILEHILGLAPHGTVREYVPTAEGMVPACPPVTPELQRLSAKLRQPSKDFCIGQWVDLKQYADDIVAREILDELIRELDVFSE